MLDRPELEMEKNEDTGFPIEKKPVLFRNPRQSSSNPEQKRVKKGRVVGWSDWDEAELAKLKTESRKIHAARDDT